MSAYDPVFFRKMNGLGNDFVILDARVRPFAMTAECARFLGDRREGIGCDQSVVILPPRDGGTDAYVEFWNQDGSLVESCGNASRCVGDLLAQDLGKAEVRLGTAGGVVVCRRLDRGGVCVDMGTPRFGGDAGVLRHAAEDPLRVRVDLPEPFSALQDALGLASVVSVGNPHCIFWVESVSSWDLAALGPVLETHPLFPKRVNVSLCEVVRPDHVRLGVWERGAGLTLACGTAACAATVAAIKTGRLQDEGLGVRVTLPGGDLEITWRLEDRHILMTGPVTYEYEGFLPEGSWARGEGHDEARIA